MTLRTIESEFSDQLLAGAQDEFPLDLTLEGPSMAKLHPRVLLAKLQFDFNPQSLPVKIDIPGWHYACFGSFEEAKRSYPQIALTFVGKPWSLYVFLKGGQAQAIIDFSPIGTIVLSKNDLPVQSQIILQHHTLPYWISYALSPELWGVQGKWTRFHERLTTLFNEKKLLKIEATLGYYPLIEKASLLRQHGFIGTSLEKSYLLVLPWTFSLGALEKLENIIRQEF